MSKTTDYVLEQQEKRNEEQDLTYQEEQSLKRYLAEVQVQDYRDFITAKPVNQVQTTKMEKSIFTREGNWYDNR